MQQENTTSRSLPGDNNPPGQIDFSKETVTALSDWMKNHPTISSEDEAREAKLLVDRGVLCSKDMVDERQAQTGPLLKQVEYIRDRYREPQNILDRVVTELQARLNAFILREEERRKAEAERLRHEAEEAERLAREAEEAERQAKEDAEQGVCDVDIGQATTTADAAFAQFKQAAKEAQRADRESVVKIGGGFRRAASLRNKETLLVDDPHLALDALGMTDDIKEAILTSARKYRTHFGELPEGVSSHKERG